MTLIERLLAQANNEANELADLLNEAVEALAQPQQEPVAWMHEWEDGERIALLEIQDDRLNDAPLSVRPLVYGDTAQPSRKPLTVDCLGLALDLESQSKRVDSHTVQRAMLAAAVGLRNIKSAHGIKEAS